MGTITGNAGPSASHTSIRQNDVSVSNATPDSAVTTPRSTQTADQPSGPPVNQEALQKGTQKHAREQASMQMLSGQIASQSLQASLPKNASPADIVAASVIGAHQKRLDSAVESQSQKVKDLEKKLSESPKETLTDLVNNQPLEKELVAEKQKLESMKVAAERFKSLPPNEALLEGTTQYLQTAGPKDRDNVIMVLANVKENLEGKGDWQEFYRKNFNKIHDFLAPYGLREFEGAGMTTAQQENFDAAVKNWQRRKEPGRTVSDNIHMPTPQEIEARKADPTTSRGPDDKGIPYKGATADERRQAKADREEMEKNKATMERINSVRQAGPFGMLGRVLGLLGGEKMQDALGALGAIMDGASPDKVVPHMPDHTPSRQPSNQVKTGEPPKRSAARETQPNADVMNQQTAGPPPNTHSPDAYAKTVPGQQKNRSEAAHAKTERAGQQTVESNPQTKSTHPPSNAGGAKVNIAEIDAKHNTLKPKNYSPSKSITIDTPDGSRNTTVGEYRKQVRAAQSWITEQMRTGQGSRDPGEMNRAAAQKFGLDPNWNSIDNPYVY